MVSMGMMMERRYEVAVGVALAACTVALGPRSAEACSPLPPEPVEPCETLEVYVPAAEFPLGLHGAIRVRNESINSDGVHSGPDGDVLDLPEPIVVERRDGSGWQSVAFELEDGPNLVDGARTIALADPRPGEYRVLWPSSTCGEPQSASGDAIVGQFTLGQDVPFPDAFGAVDVGWRVDDTTVDLGIGADCSREQTDATIGTTTISWEIPDAWLPWADASSVAMKLDGEIEYGFGDVTTDAVEAGVYTLEMTSLCAGDESRLANRFKGPTSGTHTVQLVGTAEGQPELESEVAEYEVDCDARGCSVDRRSSPPVLAGVFLLAFFGLRRRNL